MATSKSVIVLVFMVYSMLIYSLTQGQNCPDEICEPGETMNDCPRDCWLDTIQILLSGAGRPDWSTDGSNLIAFDRKGSDGYYDVYTMNPDTSDVQCITCGHLLVPQKHNGVPAWHPSGDWIVFPGEKASHGGGSTFSGPGRGRYCDLWVIALDGVDAYQLTDLPDSPDYGIIHPHFSHDGSKLSWSEMTKKAQFAAGFEMGSWVIKTADFIIDSTGCWLDNVMTYQPGDSVFYENHGFSPNDSLILFTSNFYYGQSTLTNNNIYTLNIYTNELIQLTDTKYNEHATFTNDGKKIFWGTNRENQLINPGMDYWIMNIDGTNKLRLSYFNKNGYYESDGTKKLAVDHSWNGAGDKMVVYVQHGTLSDTGNLYLFKFIDPLTSVDQGGIGTFGFSVYPNPINTTALISLKNIDESKKYRFYLYDSHGQNIYETAFDHLELKLNYERFTEGMYFFLIQASAKIVGSGKLIIQ